MIQNQLYDFLEDNSHKRPSFLQRAVSFLFCGTFILSQRQQQQTWSSSEMLNSSNYNIRNCQVSPTSESESETETRANNESSNSTNQPILSEHIKFQACSEPAINDDVNPRPLILLFAWMLAKDAHLDKYRKLWTTRGFDIITIQTSPSDLLVPAFGTTQTVRLLIDYLANHPKPYQKIIFHNLSVGNYVAFEFLYELYEAVRMEVPNTSELYDSLQGKVFVVVRSYYRYVPQHCAVSQIVQKSLKAL